MKKIIWSLCVTSLILCQVPLVFAQQQFQFKPNPKLLMSWEESVKAGKDVRPPYLVKFSTSSKSLWFIAASHSNSVETETFELVKKAFSEFKPQALIIEGVEKKPNLSAESYKFLIKDANLETTKFWPMGESAYAVAFAVKQKTACTSGEPSAEYIRAHLDKKFTLKDLFGFYVVRQIPEIKRQNPDKKVNFDEWFNKHALVVSRETIDSLSLSEFKTWYEEKNKEKFDFDKIDTNVSAPLANKNALFTQRINYSLSIVRNTAILETIADMLNQYDKVLIVYGSGHFGQQANVLEDMLGKAEIVKKLDQD
ncbi:MAG: hypothetical protein WCS77_02295 [Elusimicrobiaceae bacterium]